MTRLLAAIAVAPLAIVPVLLAAFGWWAMAHGGWRSMAGILVPGLAVAYALVLIAGVPVHLALVRQQCTRARDYALAGLLLGAVPVIGYVVVAVIFEAQFAPAALPRAMARNFEWGAIGAAVFGACSTAVALAFRAVVRASPS
jgi:hypothetical protein